MLSIVDAVSLSAASTGVKKPNVRREHRHSVLEEMDGCRRLRLSP